MKAKDSEQFLLLNAGIAEHYSDWNWNNISSPFARLYMVREGTATVHLPGSACGIRSGQIYMIPPFTIHSYECDGYFSLYYFHIYENLSSGKRILEEYLFPFGIEAGESEKALIRRLHDINPGRELLKYDPFSYDNNSYLLRLLQKNFNMPYEVSLETNGILSILISRFVSKASKKRNISDDRISMAIDYIRKNIDTDISLENLATHCCISKDHLIRLFKKETLATPLQYINLKKTEKAQLLLISTDASIKYIAQSLSFSNQSNFNRIFKQITGRTPVEYRKNTN